MSYFDDYIADGLCCECCGVAIDMDEPGFVRRCYGCRDPEPRQPRRRKRKSRQAEGRAA